MIHYVIHLLHIQDMLQVYLYYYYYLDFDDTNQVYLSRYYNSSVTEYPLLYNCTIKGNYSCVTSIINKDKYYGNIINEKHEYIYINIYIK